MIYRLAYCLSLLVVICCSGCSNLPQASGVVSFVDGQPVESGSIEFRSVQTGDRFASRIQSDGSFTLTDASGSVSFPLGEYEVVVVQIVLTEDLAAADHQHGRTVPRRYADYYTSGLSYTNTADRTSAIEIELNQ